MNTTNPPSTHHKKLQWQQRLLSLVFLLILSAFLIVTIFSMSSQMRSHLLSAEQKHLDLDIGELQNFITNEVLTNNFIKAKEFLVAWSKERPHIAHLQVKFSNGFLLVDYKNPQASQNLLIKNSVLTFPNGNQLQLNIEHDLAEIDNLIAQHNQQSAIIIAIMLFVMGIILWVSFNRLSFVPMRKEIQSQVQRLHQANLENVRMGAELEISCELQTMILPSVFELKAMPHLDIAAYMQPATEVGGDYYDVLVYDKNRIKIGIGDVTGHGLESGVLMMMVQTAVRTLVNQNITDPKYFMQLLNTVLYQNIKRCDMDKWLTLMLLDYHDGKLTVVGQHEELLLVRQNGAVERIDTIDLGFMLGLEPDVSEFVRSKTFELASGDGIVLYTDGLTEAYNSKQQAYSVERLCEQIQQHWQASSETIKQEILYDFEAHHGHAPLADDVTLLVIKQQ